MKFEGSSPHLQQPATRPYPEPDQSSPRYPKPFYARSMLISSACFHTLHQFEGTAYVNVMIP